MIKLTENELKLMLAIRDSEYNDDGAFATPRTSSPVWVSCMWGFEGKKKFGGVMASLSNKGLAWSDGETCGLSDAGLALIEHLPYECTIDRAKADNPNYTYGDK